MDDRSLELERQLIADAAKMPADDAARYLFDWYRTALAEHRDALVLALIGEVVVGQRRRASALPAGSAEAA